MRLDDGALLALHLSSAMGMLHWMQPRSRSMPDRVSAPSRCVLRHMATGKKDDRRTVPSRSKCK